jgi:hypothetical protein
LISLVVSSPSFGRVISLLACILPDKLFNSSFNSFKNLIENSFTNPEIFHEDILKL